VRALLWPAIATALVTACGGSISVDGHACPCTTGFVCCGGTNQCVGAGAACPPGSTGIMPTADNIRTLCNAPSGGAIGPPSTADAFTRVLARTWIACKFDPSSSSGLVAHEGIEFTPDGVWFSVHGTPNGYEHDPPEEQPNGPTSGPYDFSNSTLAATNHGYVPTTDTTFARELLLEWTYKGNLELQVDFQRSPLRLHTWNGVDLLFVALDDDGAEYVGTEGMACDTAGAVCRSPTRCVSENNSGVCSAPAVVGLGAGCDHKGTRKCDTGLTCSTTRQCVATQ
jgi:hypothetical protein